MIRWIQDKYESIKEKILEKIFDWLWVEEETSSDSWFTVIMFTLGVMVAILAFVALWLWYIIPPYEMGSWLGY